MTVRVLAIETSVAGGSVALLEDGLPAVVERLSLELSNTRTLAPAIAGVLVRVGWKPAELNLVAVDVGPGSFTGLRVGVTTAKVMAWTLGAAIIGVESCATIAWQTPEASTGSRLEVVIDAHRRQLFRQAFVRDGQWRALTAVEIIDLQAWKDGLTPSALVTGPGLETYAEVATAGVIVAPPDLWDPSAVSVGQLAYARYKSGQLDDARTLQPRYVRASAAEEKRSRGGE